MKNLFHKLHGHPTILSRNVRRPTISVTTMFLSIKIWILKYSLIMLISVESRYFKYAMCLFLFRCSLQCVIITNNTLPLSDRHSNFLKYEDKITLRKHIHWFCAHKNLLYITEKKIWIWYFKGGGDNLKLQIRTLK